MRAQFGFPQSQNLKQDLLDISRSNARRRGFDGDMRWPNGSVSKPYAFSFIGDAGRIPAPGRALIAAQRHQQMLALPGLPAARCPQHLLEENTLMRDMLDQ